MPRAINYLRVLTDEQAESGLRLEAQLPSCRAAAERLGLIVACIHEDDASGGLPLEKRPGLVDAVASLESGDALIVARRDRLSRGDMLTTGTIELAVRKAGARIVSAVGEWTESDDPASILMRRLVDSFAEYERLVIRARTRAALAAKRARGERAGSIPRGRRLGRDGRTLEPGRVELETLRSLRR